MHSIQDIAKEGIAALIPCYHREYGNSTEVVLLSGEPVVLPRTVNTVINGLARFYAVDLKSLRKKYGELLGCKKVVPIPLSSKLILMPVKTRKAVSRNDSSRGYVNYLAIKDVKEGEGSAVSRITLNNDRQITCYHSIKNINLHIRNCYYIHQQLIKESGEMENFSREYLDCPATKGDIALILKELREIKDKL